MKVVMSLKNPSKVPAREMNLGKYVVGIKPKQFDILKEDKWLLDTDQAKAWMNIDKPGKSVVDETPVREPEDEIIEG